MNVKAIACTLLFCLISLASREGLLDGITQKLNISAGARKVTSSIRGFPLH